MSPINSICVYCGSQNGNDPIFLNAAKITGQVIAQNELSLVYGGGSNGIMGEISNSVLENGGRITGIIPHFLMADEGSHANSENCEVFVTENMHERKRMMFEKSDAFLALPGGIGTLEEIVEIMTWAQLGRHNKPIAFLNTDQFWGPLLDLVEHMKSAGFIHSARRLNYIVSDNPSDVIRQIQLSAN
ncbi:MAG: TIGR00730 family Rossman fold protein [Pseudomonadota bacterium]